MCSLLPSGNQALHRSTTGWWFSMPAALVLAFCTVVLDFQQKKVFFIYQWLCLLTSFGQHTTNTKTWQHCTVEAVLKWKYFCCHQWGSNRWGALHLFQPSSAGTLIHTEEKVNVSPWEWPPLSVLLMDLLFRAWAHVRELLVSAQPLLWTALQIVLQTASLD